MPLRRAIVLLLLSAGVALGEPDLARYETPYYVLHTDLPPEQAREAGVRMTRMAEEYHRRTRGFAGGVRDRLPFYLYADPADYHAAGGAPRSVGQYDPADRALSATAGGPASAAVWGVVQHEGFHQFADAAVGAALPIWANEGLADYFGEAVFTGDSFVAGVVPPWRLARVRQRLDAGEFVPLERLMRLTHAEWNDDLQLAHYDQAWSMVHFLAHGDDGKYQKPFADFLARVGRGEGWKRAWRATFGDDAGFEARWRAYWTQLPDDPTAGLYARATAATLTSYLARAHAAGGRFDDFAAFASAASAGRVEIDGDDWLPPGLLAAALREADRMAAEDGAAFALEVPPRGGPRVVCTLADGTRLVGTFAVRGGRVRDVEVDEVRGKAQ